MDDWLLTALIQTGTVIGVIIFMCVVFQWVTKGFLFKYIKVFASRGSKVLVEVKTSLDSYFLVGGVVNNCLLFKTKESKLMRRVALKEGVVFYWLGVKKVVVDEEGNFFITPSKGVVSGFDAERYENYAKKMFFAGREDDINKKLLFIVLIGLALVIVMLGVVVYNVFTLTDLVEGLRVLVESNPVPVL